MTEESARRRLAAILAADVVGYVRLMEHDEAGTLATLKERRTTVLKPLVAKHEGRIFKVAGDGVLVEFNSVADLKLVGVNLQALGYQDSDIEDILGGNWLRLLHQALPDG